MAWNQMRKMPAEKLDLIRGWEAKGLGYWRKRLAACQERVRKADSSGALGRAIEDREMAEIAVRRLEAAG
jgi:hypothetical protein